MSSQADAQGGRAAGEYDAKVNGSAAKVAVENRTLRICGHVSGGRAVIEI